MLKSGKPLKSRLEIIHFNVNGNGTIRCIAYEYLHSIVIMAPSLASYPR